MKVAIIGAGLSGLACAQELLRLGIRPTIFEKKGYIGQDYLYSNTTLRIFDRTYRSSKNYLNNKYNLRLRCFSPLRQITMFGPKKKAVERGRLGYIYMRGEEKDSLENQLASNIDLQILFDSFVKIDDIKNSFDYVVVATGDETVAANLDVWTTTFNVSTRVAHVLGNFKIDSVTMWVNREYSKDCYAYLSPHSNKNARMMLSVNGITCKELDYYWKEFLSKEEIPYNVFETKDIEHKLGYVSTAKVGNIYLVGNSAGLIDDFLGFGAINAIESGILAARSIFGGLDYNELIKHIKDYVHTLHEFRKLLSRFDNKDYDFLLGFLDICLIKQLIYNNPLVKGKTFAFFAKAYNNMLKQNK